MLILLKYNMSLKADRLEINCTSQEFTNDQKQNPKIVPTESFSGRSTEVQRDHSSKTSNQAIFSVEKNGVVGQFHDGKAKNESKLAIKKKENLSQNQNHGSSIPFMLTNNQVLNRCTAQITFCCSQLQKISL